MIAFVCRYSPGRLLLFGPAPLTTLPLYLSPMALLAPTQIQENGNVVCTNTISASVMDRLNEDMTQMRTSIRESEFNCSRQL